MPDRKERLLSRNALCLDNSQLALAMRTAWGEIIGGPFVAWTPDTGTKWPHPDRRVRDRFHARVNEILYAATGIDPTQSPMELAAAKRPRRPKTDIPPDVQADIVRRYVEDEETTVAIGEALDLNHETVRRILVRKGVTIRGSAENYALGNHKRAREAAERRVRALKLAEEGKNAKQIAAALEINQSTVYVILRNAPVRASIGYRALRRYEEAA